MDYFFLAAMTLAAFLLLLQFFIFQEYRKPIHVKKDNVYTSVDSSFQEQANIVRTFKILYILTVSCLLFPSFGRVNSHKMFVQKNVKNSKLKNIRLVKDTKQ